MQYIAFDAHKHYTWALVEDDTGRTFVEGKIRHSKGALVDFLRVCEPGSPVAVETIGNWYWIVDEIEEAGMVPRLVHAGKAKVMSGSINKTDKLDVRALNRLQRAGTLPTVWIPPGELRDARELPRTRMVLVRQQTQLKNRIHATLAKYGLNTREVSDLFGVRGRKLLEEQLRQLPLETRFSAERLVEQLRSVREQIKQFEVRMKETFSETEALKLVRSIPGVGFILGIVMTLEVGELDRFPSAGHLASYAGMTPRVHASGGKVRYGQARSDVNRYLKWAYVEAANVAMIHRRRFPERHVSRLYERVKRRRGHQKAIVAVGRHLAEATYWILKRGESYKDPALKREVVSSKEA